MGLLQKIKGLIAKKPEEVSFTEQEESSSEGFSSAEDSSEEESGDSTNSW